MKKVIILLSILSIVLIGCGNVNVDNSVPSAKESQTETQTESKTQVQTATEIQTKVTAEEISMKLYINNKEIPVIWEDNQSVNELMEDAKNKDIVVDLSMYSDNEQVGPLGKRYSSNDSQTTTNNGDIVLYNSSNIVLFYGSNSWAYTRLGKMQLPQNEVTGLLSNGDVSIKLSIN